MGDGHTPGCFSSGDIVAPVGLEVCDGSHSLGVMKKVVRKSGAADYQAMFPYFHFGFKVAAWLRAHLSC